MHSASRLLRTVSLVLAALLVSIGAATPVQAASKKERYYQFTSDAMRKMADDLAGALRFVPDTVSYSVVEDIARDPALFRLAKMLCTTMKESKTSAQRKYAITIITDSLFDKASVESEKTSDVLLKAKPGVSEEELAFYTSLAFVMYAAAIGGAAKVVCPDQTRHLKRVYDAYTGKWAASL